MSSDNVIVRVTRISGAVLDLEQFETGNGDFLACGFESRSFLLVALADPWFEDDERKDRRENVLVQALPSMGDGDWFVDEKWFRENVATYIKSFTILERDRRITNKAEEAALIAKLEVAGHTTESLLEHAPCARCRAELTDAKWIQHLKVGDVFGTTAYDVWRER